MLMAVLTEQLTSTLILSLSITVSSEEDPALLWDLLSRPYESLPSASYPAFPPTFDVCMPFTAFMLVFPHQGVYYYFLFFPTLVIKCISFNPQSLPREREHTLPILQSGGRCSGSLCYLPEVTQR